MEMMITPLASSSKANCTHITNGATQLLLDAGLPVRQLRERLGFGLSKIAAALVTHCHKDHCRAVPDLLAAGVDCYMLTSTAEECGVLDHHRAHLITAPEVFTVGTWQVRPFDTPHDVDNIGFLLQSGDEKVLYLTDSPFCRYRFRGLTRILIECNYDLPIVNANVEAGVVNPSLKSRVMHNHMNLDTLCDFLRANDLTSVREIILLHLSDDSSDTEVFKRTIQALTGKAVRIA